MTTISKKTTKSTVPRSKKHTSPILDKQVTNLLSDIGSIKAAEVFWRQSDRWIKDLENAQVEGYIKKIIFDVKSMLNSKLLTIETAERYLMYSILLQNYVLHYKEK